MNRFQIELTYWMIKLINKLTWITKVHLRNTAVVIVKKVVPWRRKSKWIKYGKHSSSVIDDRIIDQTVCAAHDGHER